MWFITRRVIKTLQARLLNLSDLIPDQPSPLHARQLTLSELIGKIEAMREQSNLSSAIRLFVLHHFRGDKRKDVAKPQVSTIAAERTPAS